MKSSTKAVWILAVGLSAVTNLASAAPGLADAAESCMTRADTALKLGNFDNIDRDYGAVEISHRVYDIYLNINLRDVAGAEPTKMRVQCRSAGFGKVRQFSVTEGRWAFKSPMQANTLDSRVAAGAAQ